MARKERWEWPHRCNATMVARVFGVSAQAVGMWTGCPRNDDNSFNLRAVMEWREGSAVLKALERAGLDKGKEAGGKAMERQREASAALAELDLAERCGLVLDREDVERQLRRAFQGVKMRIESWPDRLAGLVCEKPAAECRRELTRAAEDLLRQLQEDVKEIGSDEGKEDDGAEAA